MDDAGTHDESYFWEEIDRLVQPEITDEDAVTQAVCAFVDFVAQLGAEYLQDDRDVESCCYKLLDSKIFSEQSDLARDALLNLEFESESIPKSFVMVYLLLLDGRRHPRTFKLMKRAGMTCTIAEIAKEQYIEAPRFTRLALTTLYEMCRIQKLPETDLSFFDEEYVWFLLRSVEVSRDDEDPYSYKSIKVIVSLNEQFMVATLPHTQQPFPRSPSNTSLAITEQQSRQPESRVSQNSVVKVLSAHGARFKAFGENLIRMLNRERDSSLQLLILKQLFLLCTNPATYEYFYTNDLYVLIDVFIRELYDLPADAEGLRHTYLRVLHPLLIHTQLRNPPYYKVPELVKLLTSLNQECSHFGPVGTTTVRLLARCLTVPWLLPPKRRKLKLPLPSFPERKKSEKNLGISLSTEAVSSQVSLRSIDSVNSIAKVRPPTSPRVKHGRVLETAPTLMPVVETSPAKQPGTSVQDVKKTDDVDDKTAHLLNEMSKLQVV